ncbi:MAG: ABC transporter permease [Acidobacteria bacterium]|nr:ABC transporter permease [Acidobacteriota bacterium]
MLRHLRLAVRTLLKTPFVTGVAITSLALGIGANTAIFSLFDRFLLRPLPVASPDALVNLAAPGPKPGSTQCSQAGPCTEVFSYPMFRDLERLQTSFTGVAGHKQFGANVAARGDTRSMDGELVSGSYFPTLGLQPAVGRLLTPADDTTPGAHPVAVISHGYWTSRFAQDPAIVGQPIVVNNTALTVVGVAPPGFEGTTLGLRPNLFVPLSMRAVMQPGWEGFDDRRRYWVYVFGRLKPGVTMTQAQAALEGPYRAILVDVEAPLQAGMSDQTLERFKAKSLVMTPGQSGQSSVDDEARTPLLLLMAVTALVLLTACANVANLLLARGAGRAGEMAVRLSIGAGRGQLLTQLLIESCTLSLAGGVLGLGVARVTLAGIAALLPPEAAHTVPATLDGGVLVFALVLAVGTGVLFGLYPALHATRPDLVSALKSQAGQPGGSRAASRFRSGLAIGQMALSMALLVAAGLFLKSLDRVSRVDLGLRTEQIVTFSLSPELNGYTPAQSRAFFERVEDAVAALPGVTSVTASVVALISGSNWGNGVRVEGFEAGPDTDIGSSLSAVGADFFATLGIPLLRGRDFTRADAEGRPKVAIVNEAFARKFQLGDRVVGARMSTSGGANAPLDVEIIGLAKDAKYSEVKDVIPPVYFTPYRQDDEVGSISFYAATTGDAEALLASIHEAVRRLDPNLPVENPRTMAQQVRENVFLDRMISTLSASFAALATLLAAIGLYGVLAYTVAQRTREFGLRMALGADGAMVRGLVLGQVLRMTLVGGLVGLALAIGIGRGAQSLLFEIQGWDPAVLLMSTVLLGGVAFGAGLLPALRASRIAPMVALRDE